MKARLQSFLLPLCHAKGNGLLEKVGTNPIFDRNVIGLVARFAQNLAPRFLFQWGSEGQDPGQFNNVCGIAVHSHTGMVFVSDACNDRMQSFRFDGTLVTEWGSQGTADRQFRGPYGVAILQKHFTRDWVFVTDGLNHRIQVFDVDGSFIRKWGSKGQGDGQFNVPASVAVLARSQDRGYPTQDLVFVADLCNYRVQVFGLDGTFIRKWGTPGSEDGQFKGPHGIAVHPTRDLIFISDCDNHRIQAFRSDGTFLFKWGSKGSADGQFLSPGYLALHPTRDLLFAVDCENHRVQVFDLDGSFLCKWGLKGEADGEFVYPTGVSVHHTNNMVYVGEEFRVQAFSLFPSSRKRKRISDS